VTKSVFVRAGTVNGRVSSTVPSMQHVPEWFLLREPLSWTHLVVVDAEAPSETQWLALRDHADDVRARMVAKTLDGIAKLDGSMKSDIALLTGFSPERLAELGGFDDE